MPKPYPPEFRRRALDLLESGRSVREVAASLGIAESCLHRWKRLDLIERGLRSPSPATVESAALAQARARIAELENEVEALRKAAAAARAGGAPKSAFALVAELADEGVPVKQACLALGVSRSGFYDARRRPPSARAIRQAWLTDQIAAIHQASRQTYGSPGVRAELVHGQGVAVSRKTVAELMWRAGLAGLPLRRRAKRVPASKTVTDLVKRDFRRDDPNQLWVTDITEHPTREGKLYRCVVLDAYSRRVVGWAIDSRQRADLATSALGMAIDARGIAGQISGGIIHADHGTQFTSWTFTERARRAGLLPSLGTVGDPYDNAVAEAFWGRMQTELLDRQRLKTRVELANAIFEYIEGFYNRRRRHSALDWMSPLQFETTHTSNPISSPTSP
ncbi:IS3 family transposase [Actinomadura craniellae]|uniref:IS3 family transposase n=1 Tax=Actinomadura craniellae TaxID=2231787 RepID=A0A365GV30_9ACTN|nr:IS3 family transposase [Actinomadura craniellae]RAY10649.1 IS3 family transposase [Actinomadura craniellae]